MKPLDRVVIVRDAKQEKRQLLEEVAARAGFWEDLDRVCAARGRAPAELRIAIKVNLMLLLNPAVKVVATDPELVEHLVVMLWRKGYRDIAVVESQNTGNNWLKNRSVANVARVAGYRPPPGGEPGHYRIVDLTLEMERHTYTLEGYPDWPNFVGRTWRDAEYRIDFAKFKTQLDNYYTLCTKNQFGCLPVQNKYWHYHAVMPYWACTVYTLQSFPCNFGFVDGYIGSDGAIGFAIQYQPKKLGLMLAGNNLMAIDRVGARLMSLDPLDASIMRFATRVFGYDDDRYVVEGDTTPIADWDNVPEFIQNIGDIGQAIYILANAGAVAAASQVDVEEFPPRSIFVRLYFRLLSWLVLLFLGKKVSRAELGVYREAIAREHAARAGGEVHPLRARAPARLPAGRAGHG
jgi:uncharacterized protein (DUF362 family)